MKKNKNVVIYSRVASSVVDNPYSSLDKQLEACREYCEENGLDAVMELREFGTGSATLNPGLAEYLEHVIDTQYDISGIVVADASRITRNLMASLDFLDKLEGMGVTLHTASNGAVQQLYSDSQPEIKNQVEMVKFTVNGRNSKRYTYEMERIIPKNKLRRVEK